jgi:hypothetical protein
MTETGDVRQVIERLTLERDEARRMTEDRSTAYAMFPAVTHERDSLRAEVERLKAELAEAHNRITWADDLTKAALAGNVRASQPAPSGWQQRCERLRADAMVAHRWFAKHFGESMNGRDFAVKCEMADGAMVKLAQTWQTIDSAPKDETSVMLYGQGHGYRAWMCGYFKSFSDGSAGWINSIIYTEPEDRWRGSGPTPTHWAPIPRPPAPGQHAVDALPPAQASGWQQRIAAIKRYKSGAYGAMIEDEDGKWVLLECVKDAIAAESAAIPPPMDAARILLSRFEIVVDAHRNGSPNLFYRLIDEIAKDARTLLASDALPPASDAAQPRIREGMGLSENLIVVPAPDASPAKEMPKLMVSDLRVDPEDGRSEIESHDLWLRAGNLSLLVNIQAGAEFSWALGFDGNHQEHGGRNLVAAKEAVQRVTCVHCSFSGFTDRDAGRCPKCGALVVPGTNDPIDAAVDAQLQPLAQELTDLGHRLAKEALAPGLRLVCPVCEEGAHIKADGRCWCGRKGVPAGVPAVESANAPPERVRPAVEADASPKEPR